MKLTKLVALFALALFFAPPHMAQAQAIDARADVLKNQIERLLENQKTIATRNGCRLDTQGIISVEKANGYYAFTLPNVSYTDAKGVRSEIGMLALNAIPQENNEWKISMALPTPIISYSKSGAMNYKTDLGTQKIFGIWNEKAGHFTKVDAKIDSIKINDILQKTVISLASTRFTTDLSLNAQNTYAGSGNMAVENISIQDGKTGFKGSLPAIYMDSSLSDPSATGAAQSSYPDFYTVFANLFGKPETIQTQIKGLSALNAGLQQSMLIAPANQRADYLQSILAVGAIDAMGKPKTGETDTKLYDLTFSNEGTIILNGTDISALTSLKDGAASGKR